MNPKLRLRISVFMILGSFLYAALVIYDASIAGAVASGYVALVVSLFIILNLWKKP